jgi:uncharacterized protein YcnI
MRHATPSKPLTRRVLPAMLCGLMLLITAPLARAHVVLAQKTAPAGTYYRAQFMVGHGCQGSPTLSVQVEIPDGVPVVRPQPKAGWTLSYETGPLAEPAMVHGRPRTEGIRRVIWSGGPLPDEQYDEFGMMLFLPKPGRLHFRVLQTCEAGVNDWAGVPVEGGPRPAFPAATLDVLPAQGGTVAPPARHPGGAHEPPHDHSQHRH